MKISIVVPCYNEEDNVDKFFGELKSTMEKAQYSYEIIFINDGSNDRTFDKLKKIYSKNSNRVEELFQKFRQRSFHVIRFKTCPRRICYNY